ncbi:hypothetical protein B5C34_05330 [Pacificimonas flava]|uniref:Uncharacterized protein n=2 Tax=Pacificimonas TaxID=1960290 RepID=A0A219B424_9SPHN|nr:MULTISPECIES: hypothetical protein [Pacificimonas]MBZ6377358.1 hypothetical protein [Pacificimonas aurantium]OWV32934.1 hypothetical protein B5C34_05330 [Pacificimonas flava]
MAFRIVNLNQNDGSWKSFRENWEQQCEQLDENPDSYAPDAFSAIRTCLETPVMQSSDRKSQAVSLVDSDEQHMVAAVLHWHPAPGVKGHILKVRQLTVCPRLDFGELDEDFYADVLVELTSRVYKLSENELPATEIRFHLRSPADKVYFAAFGKKIDGENVFEQVKHHGAWLHIVKRT